jgi:RNA polymerase sigma factor (sigma-70 family)
MKPTTKPSNKKIVGGFNRHEPWVIPWIYERCEAPVYEIAAKILKSDLEAEHVTNEVFQKLYFVEERKKNIKEIRDLMYKAGKNLALDRLKKQQAAQKYNVEKAAVQTYITEDEMTRNERSAALYYLLSLCKNKLSPQCQRVFDLHFIKQLTLPEVALEMKLSKQRVNNLKSTAVGVMRLEIIPRKSFLFLLNILS